MMALERVAWATLSLLAAMALPAGLQAQTDPGAPPAGELPPPAAAAAISRAR